MPTARELLEEVDALMRRNRAGVDSIAPTIIDPREPAHETSESPPIDLVPDGIVSQDVVEEALAPPLLDDIPLLTDVAEVEQEIATQEIAHIEATRSGDDDVPVLTDAVENTGPVSDDEDALIGGLPDDAFASVAGVIGGPLVPGPEVQSPIAQDDPRWSSLAEEVRMQVLQRLDLFTERGLQSQLEVYLQPIVNRASAELVHTINTHLGEVLRAYVAEAIEREIEKWRRDMQ